jgi:predicted amidohydrolase
VLLPEYLWMGLEPFGSGGAGGVHDLFWGRLWPEIERRMRHPEKAVVLGTVPWQGADGVWKNRAPILVAGRTLFQDKLCLTPWESQFEGGDVLHLWELGGIRLAALVCLDVEIPELAVLLRGAGVDVLLVPSATETLMGVERIGRCASARAVELGCAVVVAHLVGRSASSLIDENVGRVSCYLPSQAHTAPEQREWSSEIIEKGFRRADFDLPDRLVNLSRRKSAETNPAHLRVEAVTGKHLSAEYLTTSKATL